MDKQAAKSTGDRSHTYVQAPLEALIQKKMEFLFHKASNLPKAQGMTDFLRLKMTCFL